MLCPELGFLEEIIKCSRFEERRFTHLRSKTFRLTRKLRPSQQSERSLKNNPKQ